MTITTDSERTRSSSLTLSRRKLLLGLGGLGFIGIGGGGFALWNYHREHTAACIYTGYRGEISAVAWSPDGKRIACGGIPTNRSPFENQHGITHIWDAFTGAHLFTHSDPSTTGEVKVLAWSPDGTRIASAGGKDTYIWNPGNGQALVTHQEPAKYAVSQQTLAWSPDGTQIVSGGEGDIHDPLAHSWDTTTGKSLRDYYDSTPDTATGTLYGVAWSPDGQWIATVGFSTAHVSRQEKPGSTMQIWEAATGKLVFTHREAPDINTFASVSWSPTSQKLVVGGTDGLARVWDISSQKEILTYRGHSYAIWAIGWSPDGKWIASGSGDETAQIWDAATGRTAFTYRGHNNAITSLAWSPDSTYVATGGNDKTVQVWQANV